MTRKNIAIVVGSIAAGSINRKLAQALIGIAPQELDLSIVDIRDLEMLDYETEATPSAAQTTFRDAIRAADGVIFVTPEYNRSIPGALKNALDIGSRPYGQSVWNGKPAATIGTSPGAAGTAMAQQHLCTILTFFDMPLMGQPETYLRYSEDLITPEGNIGPKSHDFLKGWLEKFAGFVARHS